MQEKISEYLGELEGVYDDVVFNNATYDLYNELRGKQIPMQYVTPIINWANKRIKEIEDYLSADDEEVREAYPVYGTKTRSKQIIKLLNQFITDAERYGQFKKANRKPKAKRTKPASQQVAKLKYMREFAELGLKSIPAADMIGAEQVWIYNTANKKLAAYRTDSATGIQVKGTTLQNYDPDISEQRTLRKPEVTLKATIAAGKIQLRKILTDQSTKSAPVNGRLNEDCIILRVVK